MKIGFVLDDSLDKSDGVQQYVLTLGDYFETQGHKVHYLVGASERKDVRNIHSLAKTLNVKFNHNRVSTPLPASTQKIKTVLDRELFDILHVQMPYSPLFAAKVIRLAHKRSAIIGTFHIIPFSRFEAIATRALGTLLKPSLDRFDKIVSVSSVAQQFCKQVFLKESLVLPNVVDTKRFRVGKPIYKKQNEVLIVFLGRLVERKGAGELLKAIAALKTDKTFRVVLCGKGPLEKDLKRYVGVHDLDDRVTFAGFVSEAEKADYLASADIAVFPSTGGESFGIVLIEAMAAGSRVVLGGNNSGYRSVMGVRPEQLFDPTNTQEFTRILENYIASESKRSKAYLWQKTFVKQFDVVVVGDQLINTYKEAIAKKHKNDDN